MPKAKSKYLPQPKYDNIRVGCKVSWLYFKDEAAARAAVPIAKHNAALDEAAGYDFGYQSPGSIRKMGDDGKGEFAQYNGLWEVCFS